MAAQRYREFVRPALVDVAARSTRSGGEQAALAVADAIGSFRKVATQVSSQLNQKKGAEAGAAAGSAGEPDFMEGLRGMSAYGRAYNNAALRSYAIRSEMDLKEQAARLEVEAGTDPDSFREAMEKMREATLEEAPAEAHAVLNEAYSSRLGQGLANIQAKLSTELRTEDRNLVNEQSNQLIERISYLKSQDTEEAHAEADQETARLELLLNAAAEDGTITEAERRTAETDTKRAIVSQTVRSRFANELNSPYGDPIGFINDLKEINRTSEVLPPDEESKLVGSLFSELRERNALLSAERSRMTAEEKARFDAGERVATVGILSRQMSTNDLIEMVADGDLDPAVARTLSNMGDVVKSDPEALFRVETNAVRMSEQEIRDNPSLTWDDKSRIILSRRDEVKGWKGTQRAKEAFDRIDRALGILPGTPMFMLTEEQQRARDAALTTLYDEVDALPAEERDSVIFDVTNRVIKENVREQAITELQKNRNTQTRYQMLLADPDLEIHTRKSYEEMIQNLKEREQQLINESQ